MIYLFLFICFFIILCELKGGKSLASPSSLVSISSLIGLFFAYIGEKFYSFYPVSNFVYALYSGCLLLFYVPSIFFYKYKEKRKYVLIERNFSSLDFYLMLILIVIGIVHLYKTLSCGFIGSESFENQYSRGLGAHNLNLIICFSAFYLLFIKKKIFSLLLFILLFILIFLSGTKYHILFVISAFLIKFLYTRPSAKKIIKLSVIICIVVFAMFMANYFINFLLKGYSMDNFFSFVMGHFAKYIGGGFIAVGRIIEHEDIMPSLFNSQVSSGFESYILISSKVEEYTNVYTLFGGILLSYGYIRLIIFTLVLSIVSNIIYYGISNKFTFLAYSFFIGIPLLMTFFSPYWGLFNVWEWAILSIILGFLLSKKNYKIYKYLCRYLKK
ncbi:MAG: oligosaccharide repeat unit polymerase [Bacteroidales bacterium]|nr:oligosaccharide repeat unit polymerase [Bacteroidales bacterium]